MNATTVRPPRAVSLVVPMYNEERSLPHLLDVALDTLPRHAADWEVVLVDDASTDGTAAVAAGRAGSEPRIRIVRHGVNRGLGGALKSGFAAATKGWVLYSDCDLPWDLDETGRLFRAAELTGADVVSGYRHDRTGEGPLRTIYSFLYNGLVQALFRFPIRDVNFSCKLIRRSFLDGLALESEGSFIDAELLVRLRNRGALIQQVGLDYFPRTRGVSTLSSPRTILRILRDLARLTPALRAERRRIAR
ncbi:MAG: glycosyltransferase family 2 protein [Holophagales bacterium]|nr:glycosyltransferase family 2 protein [Holophagales bacterium]